MHYLNIVCHYAECGILFITMLNVIMLNDNMLNAIMLFRDVEYHCGE
jgi:hypothetical protein